MQRRKKTTRSTRSRSVQPMEPVQPGRLRRFAGATANFLVTGLRRYGVPLAIAAALVRYDPTKAAELITSFGNYDTGVGARATRMRNAAVGAVPALASIGFGIDEEDTYGGIGGMVKPRKAKRKPSAWQSFVKKHSPAVMKKHPNMTLGQKMKLLGKMYKK